MKYDYWVKVQELIPPLGENRFFAIAEIHEIGKGKADYDLGEVWGKTREEAEEKMNKKIIEWVNNNS